MSLITDFLHIQMRKEDIGLVLLTRKVITLLTDGTNQIITRSAVRECYKNLFKPQAGPTTQGRINHEIWHLMCLFIAGLILMDLKTSLLCPLSILMTYWGELLHFLWMRMRRERELLFLIIPCHQSRSSFQRRSTKIQAQN